MRLNTQSHQSEKLVLYLLRGLNLKIAKATVIQRLENVQLLHSPVKTAPIIRSHIQHFNMFALAASV